MVIIDYLLGISQLVWSFLNGDIKQCILTVYFSSVWSYLFLTYLDQFR